MGIHVPVVVAATSPDEPPSNNDDADTGTGRPTTTKLLNRTIWILPTGDVDPSRNYDKLHLFDYGNLRESAHTQRGTSLTPPFDTPVGRVGSLICFDLRFPEPATALAHPRRARGSSGGGEGPWEAAQVLTYPSAFTVPTGRAHWATLLRARAIEAQCWVVAAAQAGWHSHASTSTSSSSDPSSSSSSSSGGGGGEGRGTGRVSYGGSMVVDPWGEVRCVLPAAEQLPDGGEVVVPEGAVGALGLVNIDLGVWEGVRERMPLVRRT